MKKYIYFGLLMLSAAPVMADSMTDKVERLEHDLILLQRKVYNASGNGVAMNGDVVDEMLNKVTTQEQLLQELTERVENFGNDIREIKEKQTKMNADYDVRFKMVEQDVADLKEAMQNLKSQPMPAPIIIPAVAETGSGSQSVQAQYDAAYKLLQTGEYNKAATAFADFIKANPNDKLAGNANYWLGETYYAQGQYEQAIGVFADGFTTYKDNIKAPDSLLKLGMSMSKLDKKDEACTAFKSVVDEFPKADNSIKTRAAEEAGKIKCP